MSKVASYLSDFWKDESGISSVEYALLLAFVGGGVIAGAVALSDAVQTQMDDTAACINSGDPSNASC